MSNLAEKQRQREIVKSAREIAKKIAKNNAKKKKKKKTAKKKTARKKGAKSSAKLNVRKMINSLLEVPLGKKTDHDNQVEAFFEKYGFRKLEIEEFKEWYNENHDKKYIKKNWQKLMILWVAEVYPFDMCYMSQPNGTQLNPDYYIFINGACIAIDAKSGKTGKATWNSSLPFKDSLYLISRTETDLRTVIIPGDEIVRDEEVVEIIERFFKKIAKDAKECNLLLKKAQKDTINEFYKYWLVYARKMCSNTTAWVYMENEKVMRKKVIERIKNLITNQG